jgi:hypothetical protein
MLFHPDGLLHGLGHLALQAAHVAVQLAKKIFMAGRRVRQSPPPLLTQAQPIFVAARLGLEADQPAFKLAEAAGKTVDEAAEFFDKPLEDAHLLAQQLGIQGLAAAW